ncbi:uncharacterized protein LOC142466619 [Ascaphus truei]|uniref:uncharacterized protein LOC142466619 n=1 Tax=Ascaphus truei TaxID=8439 RepID=UPI003F5A91A0
MLKLVCLALILGLSLPSADAASCDYCSVYNAVKSNHDDLKQRLLNLPISLQIDLNLPLLVRVNLKELHIDTFYVSLYTNKEAKTVIRVAYHGNMTLDVEVPLVTALGLGSTKTASVYGYLEFYIDILVNVDSSGKVEYVFADASIQAGIEVNIEALDQLKVKVKGAIFFPVALAITTKLKESGGVCDEYVNTFNSAGIVLCSVKELCPASST